MPVPLLYRHAKRPRPETSPPPDGPLRPGPRRQGGRLFHTTPRTVRKWRDRFDGSLASLADRRLPRYQYTARDVTTGLAFLGYSDELALSYATVFADRIHRHLAACGLEAEGITWQTDNGSEFIGSWQAKDDSAFTVVVETAGAVHRTIPVGQHRYQADVETVHSLMETEFYEIETFRDRDDFLRKAAAYNLWFNLARRNSGKEDKTPWELVQEKLPDADPHLPLLAPVFLDELFIKQLHNPRARGYDVWALPSSDGSDATGATGCLPTSVSWMSGRTGGQAASGTPKGEG